MTHGDANRRLQRRLRNTRGTPDALPPASPAENFLDFATSAASTIADPKEI